MEIGKMTVQEFETKIAEMISGSLSKNLSEAAALAVDAKLKELGVDKIAAKMGALPASFLGKSQEELDKMSKGQKAAAFIKACFRKDFATLSSMKAMSESTDSAGGFLVPEEYAAEINRIAEDFGLVRKFARKLTMKRDSLSMPVLGSSVSVSWPGEGTAGTHSQPALQRTKLQAKTAMGLTVLSNELLEDADVDLTNVLAELFAEALAGEEDNQGLAGTGIPFTGILNAAGTTTVNMASGKTAFTDISYGNLVDLIANVKPLALVGAGFVMHRTVWASVQKLADTAGMPIISQARTPIESATPGAAGSPAGYVLGYPVYLSEKMPSTTAVSTKFVIFGSLRNLWLGDRKAMTLKISDSATVGGNNTFEENESALRVTERVAIAVGLPAGFSILKTAAS